MTRIAIDFETAYSSNYSVADLGPWAYCHDKRFDAYLVGVADDTGSSACHPKDFDWERVNGKVCYAHNAGFDRAVFDKLKEDGIVPSYVTPAAWVCTAAMSRYLQCPGALDGAAKAILNVDVDKSPRSNAKGKQTADLFGSMAAYCAKDAELCWQIANACGKFWPQFERDVWEATERICRRGIYVDVDYLVKQMRVCQSKLVEAASHIPWATSDAPSSPNALADACARVNVPAPESTDEDSQAFATWMQSYGQTPAGAWVSAIREWRKVNRSLRVLETVFERLRPDSRIDAALIYHGATTGRWTGGGHGLNLQNLNTDDSVCDLRGVFSAPPGRRLLSIDLSQIEARVTLWLAGDQATLDMIASTGMSIYEAHARRTMGWAGGKLKDENPELYKLAKARVLGLGFGCGAAKFVDVARAMADLIITPEEARKQVEAYRAENPLVTKLWDVLEDACWAHHGWTWSMELPSGRKLRYRNIDKDEGTAEQVKGRRTKVYGGLLCENKVQATARDIFAESLLALEKAGFEPVLLIHDEVLLEVDAANAEAEMLRAMGIMQRAPLWAVGLPVSCEGVVLDRYAK